MSLPVRECGLKFLFLFCRLLRFYVTPRAGVWIEIFRVRVSSRFPRSLPVRECGLKSLGNARSINAMESLPVRECGLKFQCRNSGKGKCIVTPRAGVWIEIFRVRVSSRFPRSLPVRECGLKLHFIKPQAMRLARHSPCGSVD